MTPPAAGALEQDEPSFSGSGASGPRLVATPSPGILPVDLQQRINQMQTSRLDSRRLPTVPALARILPGGGLQSGGSYSVRNSAALAMALLAGPSAQGAWCGVVGLPEFSVEAAREFGINLDRLILVPAPGAQWLTVTAALVDVVSVVLTRAPEHLAPTDAARLKARLRQRGAAMITLGSWQQSDSTLGVAESAWEGLGSGRGHLRARRMKITATHPSGRSRHAYLWLADLQHGLRDPTGGPLPAGDATPGSADGGDPLFWPTLMNS